MSLGNQELVSFNILKKHIRSKRIPTQYYLIYLSDCYVLQIES